MARPVSVPLVGGDPDVRADDPEPSIYALLDDPVTKLVMERDGIHRTELLYIVEVARMRLAARRPVPHASVAMALCAEFRV